ncbi:hypothetical protein BgiBS90_011181 [Biomphalaria glabrata]|nr:hypothetical protein BgiBS90_011181 [Biomphalaria glabrata]
MELISTTFTLVAHLYNVHTWSSFLQSSTKFILGAHLYNVHTWSSSLQRSHLELIFTTYTLGAHLYNAHTWSSSLQSSHLDLLRNLEFQTFHTFVLGTVLFTKA